MGVPKDLVSSIKTIAPLSQSATKLMELVESEEYGLTDITHIVELDPALTANVLKVVNAPAFGLGQTVESVARAVSFLGDKTVVGIAIGSCSPDVFGKPLEGYHAEQGELWEHCLFTAMAARELAGYMKEPGGVTKETAFTAGILHDIGKAVIAQHMHRDVEELVQAVSEGQAESFSDAERDAVGLDHMEVGLGVAIHWKLPMPLSQCIRYHHSPMDAVEEHRGLVYVVHVADALAMMAGYGTGADALLYSIDDGFSEYLDITPEALEIVMANVSEEFEKTKTALHE